MSKENQFLTLCLVKSDKAILPVICPNTYMNIGDIVFFDHDGVAKMGYVTFEQSYVEIDDKLWTMALAAFCMEPLKATKIARVSTCEWGKEDDSAEKT